MQGTIGVSTPVRANPAPFTAPDGVLPAFLGTAAATRGSYRRAIILTALLLIAFSATAPSASRALAPVPSFAPVYDAVVAILDLITALLLYTQFRQTQERSFLALASGYVFTPVLIVAHALSFPDAFRPGSVIGGAQTTAWLWVGWHTVFPLFVIAYALLARSDRKARRTPPLEPYVPPLTIAAAVALALGIIVLTTSGESLLPPLMVGSSYESTTRLFLSAGWLAHMVALTTLVWLTGVRRVIDLWIAVTLVALLIDLALSAILVNGRYEVGFYLGRAYGLVGAIAVLAVLLRETVALYSHAVRAARDVAMEQSMAERDELRRQLVLAEEEERRRLARELHDELGQHLTALGLRVQALADWADGNEQIVERAKELREMVNALGRDLHSVAVRLRPKALDDFGLDAALNSYAEEWSRRTGIAVDIHANHGPGRLPMAVESAIYRVVQEALTNIARHSGATRAGIVVERRDGNVVAIIEDSGKGFDTAETQMTPTDVSGGLGLLGVRERASLLGGSIDIESSPGGGTTLFVRIPISGSRELPLDA